MHKFLSSRPPLTVANCNICQCSNNSFWVWPFITQCNPVYKCECNWKWLIFTDTWPKHKQIIVKSSILLKYKHQVFNCKVDICVCNADQVNIQTHKTITDHVLRWLRWIPGRNHCLSMGQYQASSSIGLDLIAVCIAFHRAIHPMLFPPNSEMSK